MDMWRKLPLLCLSPPYLFPWGVPAFSNNGRSEDICKMEFNSSLYLSPSPSLLNAPIKANLSMLSLLRGIGRALTIFTSHHERSLNVYHVSTQPPLLIPYDCLVWHCALREAIDKSFISQNCLQSCPSKVLLFLPGWAALHDKTYHVWRHLSSVVIMTKSLYLSVSWFLCW